jgi:hypothetical protein
MQVMAATGMALLLSFGAAQANSPSPYHGHEADMPHGSMADMSSLQFREGLHMAMTAIRHPNSSDEERARQIVERARLTLSKYRDSRLAEQDGYHIVRTPVERSVYHFTSYEFLKEAESGLPFRADHPVSLIYGKRRGGFMLIGVMYYAPHGATEEDLDKRVPLGIARWHEHVNVCMPPPAQLRKIWEPNPRFGETGSISTQSECEKAGGTFLSHIYGWMVHMYLFERDSKEIWSMDRVSREEDKIER